MTQQINLLMRQFLVWVDDRPRSYAEAMEAWRSSCPRLTIWEDAWADDLIQILPGGSLARSEVALTPRGRAALARQPEQG